MQLLLDNYEVGCEFGKINSSKNILQKSHMCTAWNVSVHLGRLTERRWTNLPGATCELSVGTGHFWVLGWKLFKSTLLLAEYHNLLSKMFKYEADNTHLPLFSPTCMKRLGAKIHDVWMSTGRTAIAAPSPLPSCKFCWGQRFAGIVCHIS